MATPPGADSATLLAAKNEFESFQVVVQAGTSAITGLRVDPGAQLTGPGGAAIPSGNVTIYREHNYEVTTPSDNEGGTGPWPDALIPERDYFYGEDRNAFPLDVPTGSKVVAWVDVLVPADQPPGLYAGSVLVKSGASVLYTVPVTVTVKDFALPSTPTRDSAFLTRMRYPNAPCDAHTGHFACNWDDEKMWALYSLYARAALENRLTISNPFPLAEEEAPSTDVQRTLFARYILPLVQGQSPQAPATVRPVRLAGARLKYLHMFWRCLTDSATCLTDWKTLAATHAFGDRMFFYACDEPGADSAKWANCKANARGAAAKWPGLTVLVTATIQDAKANGADQDLDILTPLVNWMDNRNCCGARFIGNQRDEVTLPDGTKARAYDNWLAQNRAGTPVNRLWLYTSCFSFSCDTTESDAGLWKGWPGYAIDQPASQARAMGWLSFEYDTTGELFWNTTWMLKSAWTNQLHDEGKGGSGNGDGTLFYPGIAASNPFVPAGAPRIGGTNDIPIESIRLKRIRDGMEDYEYLAILAQKGRKAEAMGIVQGLLGPRDSAMYSSTVTQAALDDARVKVSDMIAPPPPPPPTTTAPPPVTTSAGCTISGTTGNDTLTGTAGNDVLCGLGGNDVIKAGAGTDTIDGGSGTDRVSYEAATGAVTVNLHNGEGFGAGAAGDDKLVSIEEATGSAFDDTLVGSAAANRLSGLAGADTVYGEGSAAFTAGGADSIYGGDGDDRLLGYVGDDILYGEGGSDNLDGGQGADRASYGTSTAAVTVNLHNKEAFGTGAGGKDVLTSIEDAGGSAYSDTLVGSEVVNRIYGFGGADTIYGEGSGAFTTGSGDLLYGGDANDSIFGFVGDDKLYGGNGDDALNGGAGTDTCAQEGIVTGTGTRTACEL